MRQGWQERTLGEVCGIARGGSPRPIQAFLTNSPDGINWVKISDATASGKYIYTTAERIKPAGAARSRVVEDGDFLLSNSMSFGRPYIMRTAGCIHDGWLVLSKYQESFSADFLYHLLGSPQVFNQFDRLAAGSTVRNLNIDLASRVLVPVPPLAEQQRIVAILDEAFEAIAAAKSNAEKNLQNARDILDSHLRSVFSVTRGNWKTEPLRNIANSCLGKMLDKTKNKGEFRPYLRNLNVRWFSFDLTDVREMRFTEDEFERYSVRRGDVVICEGGYPGRAAIWQDDEPIYFQKALHRVRFDDTVLARWFLYFLYSEEGSGMLRQHFTGTGIQHFTGAALSNLIVPVGPLSTMSRHVETFDALSLKVARLESIYRAKLTALDELKNSLLQQAFTGQLASSKQSRVTKKSASQTATSEFVANVISFAYARHEKSKREKTFGHVKAQKLLHLIESIAGVDLGRQPIKDAAGPNDFQHMLEAEEWAKAHSLFDMVKRGEGYEFRKLSKFDEHMPSARKALAPYLPQLEPVIDLLVPMNTKDAEVFATVHAAWNNLLIDGIQATDDAIMSAAREGWHPNKLDIPEDKFRSAIEKIRQKELTPDGSAKYVGGQKALFDKSVLLAQQR